jgi:hypothetical protein
MQDINKAFKSYLEKKIDLAEVRAIVKMRIKELKCQKSKYKEPFHTT